MIKRHLHLDSRLSDHMAPVLPFHEQVPCFFSLSWMKKPHLIFNQPCGGEKIMSDFHSLVELFP